MDTRSIGSLRVSIVGLGCNNFGRRLDSQATERVVHAALDAGITFFDTADIYGNTESEVFLGRALAGRRGQAIIATKFGMRIDDTRQGANPHYVRRAVEDSLKRLNVEQIDLYQLHQPDKTVPIAETLGALDALARSGKVREIGCSNFTAEQLDEARAAAAAGAKFVSVQNEYSLLHRDPERAVLGACARLGMAFLPYFPLASGLLTGKYKKGTPPPAGARLAASTPFTARFLSDANLETVDRLGGFAARHGRTLLELAISWLLARPTVASVIAGATSPEQVRANAAAAGWRLDQADLTEIDGLAPAGAPAA